MTCTLLGLSTSSVKSLSSLGASHGSRGKRASSQRPTRTPKSLLPWRVWLWSTDRVVSGVITWRVVSRARVCTAMGPPGEGGPRRCRRRGIDGSRQMTSRCRGSGREGGEEPGREMDGPEGWSGRCLATGTRVGFVSRDGIAGGIDESWVRGPRGVFLERAPGVEDAGKAQWLQPSPTAVSCRALRSHSWAPPWRPAGARHQSGEARSASVAPAREGRAGITTSDINSKKRNAPSLHLARDAQHKAPTSALATATNM